MKSLSLQRPLILMMIGVPGSGKSFFARQFAETFQAPLVSTDFLRSCISQPARYDTAEETTVDAIAEQQIRELLKTQKTFLIDGGLSARVDRFALEKLAREHEFSTLTVWVQTDEPTCLNRVTRRNPKRVGDMYNSSLSEAQFHILSKRLTAPGAQEPFVVISGKHTYATQAKVVLKKLVASASHSAPQTPGGGAYSTQAYDHPSAAPAPAPRRNITIN